jgi:hypothetical protein
LEVRTSGEGRVKVKSDWEENVIKVLHIHIQNRVIKPIKIVFKVERIRKSSRGDKFDPSILYTYVKNYNETPLYN